jgi:hypothetical protein
MSKLWLPPKVAPTAPKKEGGTYFDDELQDRADYDRKLMDMARELVQHINHRPDHHVFVGSAEDREKMRSVFNWWRSEGVISHVPTIKIDYGVPEQTVRVAEPR